MSTQNGRNVRRERSRLEPTPDDADELLSLVQDDPVATGSFDDAEMRAQLVSSLIAARLALPLTQHQVAEVMETTQPTVSDFENGRVEIRLSALQRYARALGSELNFSLSGVSTSTAWRAAPSGEADDLDNLLDIVASNAVAQASFRDAEGRADLVATLVTTRKNLGLSQQQIAEATEITQSAVSDLENGRTDTRLSAVQRYARALGSKIEVTLDGTPLEVESPALVAFVAHGRQLAASAGIEDLIRPMLRTDTNLCRRGLISESRLSSVAAEMTLQKLIRSGFMKVVDSPEVGGEANVQIDEKATCFIGISIRRDHIKGIRTTGTRVGDNASVSVVDIKDTAPEAVLRAIIKLVEILSEKGKRAITAIGVELAGPVSADTGTVMFAPDLQPDTTASWTSYPLEREIQNRTGILTVVTNDANALATYEHVRNGSSGGLIVVNLGESNSGIGTGLVFNGRLIYGVNGLSGELGHTIITPSGTICARCGGHRRGCLETEASLEAIRNKLGLDTIHEVSVRADASDRRVNRAFSTAGRQLGDALGHLSTILNPARVVIYGAPILVQDGNRTSQFYTSGVIRGVRNKGFMKVQDPEFVVTRMVTGPVAAAVTAFDWLLSKPENWARSATLDPLAALVATPPKRVPEHTRVLTGE